MVSLKGYNSEALEKVNREAEEFLVVDQLASSSGDKFKEFCS